MSHCLSCLDDPSFGLTPVLSQLLVLLSHLWELKRKKEGKKEKKIQNASCWL